MDSKDSKKNSLDLFGAEIQMSENLNNFPFKTSLSFLPVIKHWEEKAKSGNKYDKKIAKDVLKAISDKEVFRSEEIDPAEIYEYQDEIRLLLSDVFPASFDDEKLTAAIVPFTLLPIYATRLFWDSVKIDDETFQTTTGMDFRQMIAFQTIAACVEILNEHYNTSQEFHKPMVFTVEDPDTGLKNHYKLDISTRYCNIKTHGKLKKLDAKAVQCLFDKFYDIDNWLENLPPENFEFSGFAVINMTEITMQESVSLLTRDLLEPDAIVSNNSLEDIQAKLRNLLRVPELKIGVGAFDTTVNQTMNTGNSIWNSFLIEDKSDLQCSDFENSFYDKALTSKKACNYRRPFENQEEKRAGKENA